MNENERTQQFEKVCDAAEGIFAIKNEQYGDSITATGVIGASVEIIGLAARIKKLVIKYGDGGEGHRDILIDVFKDLHNYANIALMMLAEENWLGV